MCKCMDGSQSFSEVIQMSSRHLYGYGLVAEFTLGTNYPFESNGEFKQRRHLEKSEFIFYHRNLGNCLDLFSTPMLLKESSA